MDRTYTDYYWGESKTQSEFDSIFYGFAGCSNPRMSRQEYVKLINGCWVDIPDRLRRSLQSRKDSRTLGQFALSVYDNSARESFLIDQWLKSIGREDVKIKDHGIANDGRLIADTRNGGGNADYWLTSTKGQWPLEVKFCPVPYKMTFKVCDLKSYSRADALVLIIIGNAKMIGPNGDADSEKRLALPIGLTWALFGRDTVKRMLKEVPIKPHKEVGNKPSIQIRDRQIGDYLNIREWNYDASEVDVSLVD